MAILSWKRKKCKTTWHQLHFWYSGTSVIRLLYIWEKGSSFQTVGMIISTKVTHITTCFLFICTHFETGCDIFTLHRHSMAKNSHNCVQFQVHRCLKSCVWPQTCTLLTCATRRHVVFCIGIFTSFSDWIECFLNRMFLCVRKDFLKMD